MRQLFSKLPVVFRAWLLLFFLVKALPSNSESQTKYPTEKEIDEIFNTQLINLAALRKKGGRIKILDQLGGEKDIRSINTCSKFWSELTHHEKLIIPHSIYFSIENDDKGVIGEKLYTIALQNRKVYESMQQNGIKEFSNLLEMRSMYANMRSDFEKDGEFPSRSKLMEILFAPLANPFEYKKSNREKLGSQPPPGFISQHPPTYNQIHLLYENDIALKTFREVILITAITTKSKRISLINNGVAINGSLINYIDNFDYGFFYGITDAFGSFDESTYEELKPWWFSANEPPTPSILNGLIKIDGIIFSWSLKNASAANNINITNAIKSMHANYFLSLIDLASTNKNQCNIIY